MASLLGEKSGRIICGGLFTWTGDFDFRERQRTKTCLAAEIDDAGAFRGESGEEDVGRSRVSSNIGRAIAKVLSTFFSLL